MRLGKLEREGGDMSESKRRECLIRNLRKRLILDKVETMGFVTDDDLLKQTEGTLLRAIAEVDVLWRECCTAVFDFLARLLPPYRKG